MDEDNSSIPGTPKSGIGASRTSSTPISEGSAISGIRSEVGSSETVPNKSADQMNLGMTEVLTTDAETPKPVWPPTAEDLKRLYIDQKLSGAMIAVLCGLARKFARPNSPALKRGGPRQPSASPPH